LAVALVIGILFGLGSALKSYCKLLSKTAARGSSVVRRRTQSGFIVVQVALTFVFLLGAGLLFRTIRHLWNVNPGFVTNNVITFRPRSRLQ
jgi:hypothetical protein